MRKSRAETAVTRAKIIANASRLFLTKGLAAVGTRDVMAAADIAPGGFYRHFDSKEQLIAEAYQSAVDRLFEMLGSAIAGKKPKEALQTVIEIYLRQSPAVSPVDLCPLAMLGSELKHADHHIQEVAILGFSRFVDLIEDQLTQLDKPNTRMIAAGMSTTLVGAVILASITTDKKRTKQILKDAAAYAHRDLD